MHGRQEGRYFPGYCDRYCFLPRYVFCGEHLLVAYLRRSKIDPARHAWAILAFLVKRFRQVWPQVRITFRGDRGFCRHPMLDWCDAHDVGYVVDLAKNQRLKRFCSRARAKATRQYRQRGRKVKRYLDIWHAAVSWRRRRRVIVKVEHGPKGENPRFVVTNLSGPPKELYEQLYCARGEMENRIKEQQLWLFADRTSCHHWWPNPFRLLLSSMAYVLMQRLRQLGLRGTELARAQCHSIRTELLKVGAVMG